MADPALPGIVFFGTPAFAVPSLKILLENELPVAAVVTAPDKPAGRGLKLRFPAVKTCAIEHGLPVLQPLSLKDPAFLETLYSLGHELQVVVAFRKLPAGVWQYPRLGTFNLHASLLPDYRGAAPVNWALINGEKETGLTTFLINEQLDAGNILIQESVPVPPDMNAGELHDVLMYQGARLVLDTVKGLMKHRLSPVPQPEMLSAEKVIHPAPKLTRDHCRIDWSADATRVNNLIRGLSPDPGAFSVLRTAGSAPVMVKILAAKPLTGETSPGPGVISSDFRTFLQVGCGQGVIAVNRLQLEGRKPLNVKEFLNGWTAGVLGCFGEG